jgi:hypothetical protein
MLQPEGSVKPAKESRPSNGADAKALELLRTALERDGARARLAANGFCMEPCIRDGDRVVVASREHLRPGDIVLACTLGRAAVCHRLLEVEGSTVVLAGDRSAAVEVLPRAAIVGVVLGVERGGRELELGPMWRGVGRVRAAAKSWSLRRELRYTRWLFGAGRRLVDASTRLAWRLASRPVG